MSLFRRKPPEDAEPKLGEHPPAMGVATESNAVQPPNQSPVTAPTKSEGDPEKPENRLSSDNRPNQGAIMASSSTPSAGFVPEIPRRSIDLPGAPGRKQMPGQRGGSTEGKRLTVGREISLSGEITACETLIVEGSVEATLENSLFLEIAEGGIFKGTVVIDEAVISGTFEGSITARQRLSIKSTGRITGTVKFHQMEIELGGEIDGDIHVLRGRAEPEPTASS
jgi:cytoskeletal protein CcmA (bactofilin family)